MLSTTPLHNIQLWKAVVIDPSTEEGRVRFARLKSKGIIQCENDTLENQVAELAIIRKPSLKDNPMGLANAISATIGEKNWDTYGRWVVFPWNGNAVRLLPPESFIEVRGFQDNNGIDRAVLGQVQ